MVELYVHTHRLLTKTNVKNAKIQKAVRMDDKIAKISIFYMCSHTLLLELITNLEHIKYGNIQWMHFQD